MSDAPFKDTSEEQLPQTGLPLGGLGTGFFELGGDGRFRNLCINSNRLLEDLIPEAPNSFIAVRAESDGRSQIRVLQEALAPEEEWAAQGRFAGQHILHRSTYPACDFQFMAPDFPLQITWSTFAPVIPYDYDAATMPAVFLSLRIRNLLSQPVETSVVFNWENWAGCGAGDSRGRVAVPVQMELEDNAPSIKRDNAPKPAPKKKENEDDDDGDVETVRARFNAIVFEGQQEGARFPSEHCIALDSRHVHDVSVFLWDPDNAEDTAEFWECLDIDGAFHRAYAPSDRHGAGALCAKVNLPPSGETRLDFVLSWYAPGHMIGGRDLGNGYTNKFDSAADVAQRALRRVAYYFRSVEDWQRRLNSASIPKWLGRMLMSSCAVLTSNTLHTKDGQFILLTSPHGYEALPIRYRLYTSFGLLLFFPRFEENEMGLLVQAIENRGTGEMPAGLDAAAGFEAAFEEDEPNQAYLAAQFIISAYRNFGATGNLNRLKTIYPQLKKIIAWTMRGASLQDGLPLQPHTRRSFDGIVLQGEDVITAGLWCTAMRAYSAIARIMGEKNESAKAAALSERAILRCEERFWDERGGFYRLCHDQSLAANKQPAAAQICHEAQLLGQWYGELLGLTPLFKPTRVQQALASIEEYNLRSRGLTAAVLADGRTVSNPPHHPPPSGSAMAWPPLSIAHFGALQVYRGNMESSLQLLEKYYRTIHYKHGLQYHPPLQWHLEKDEAVEPLSHPAALSIWYMLYAMEGISFFIPEGRLRITPRLIKGTHSLDLPLFLPSCFGWLKFQEDSSGGYRQRFKVSFDSPIRIDEVCVRVPGDMKAFSTSMETTDGVIETTLETTAWERNALLTVKPVKRLVGVTSLSLLIQRDEKQESEDKAP